MLSRLTGLTLLVSALPVFGQAPADNPVPGQPVSVGTSNDVYQIYYFGNPISAASAINLTNTGRQNGGFPDPTTGRICVNVYVFDPNAEIVDTCACLLAPNALASYSVKNDLISNPRSQTPSSVTVKLVASAPVNGGCDPSTPVAANLALGMRAWGLSVRSTPLNLSGSTQPLLIPNVAEFSTAELSQTELNKLSSLAASIETNASGTGICKACTPVLGTTPPAFTKVFGTANLQFGSSTPLSFMIANPAGNTSTFTSLAFTDMLPSGLVISTPNGLVGSCGGGTISATAGGSLISLSGASLAPGASCTFSVNVTGVTPGGQNNATSTLTDAQGVFGAPATATITVAAPTAPTISKAFADSTIELLFLGTTLSFTLTNPNATTLSGIAVTDVLPVGLALATPSDANLGTCNGATLTAPSGGSAITLSGLTLAGGASCTFSVQVAGTAIGVFTNISGPVTAFGGTVVGNTASALINVQDLFFMWFFSESGAGAVGQH